MKISWNHQEYDEADLRMEFSAATVIQMIYREVHLPAIIAIGSDLTDIASIIMVMNLITIMARDNCYQYSSFDKTVDKFFPEEIHEASNFLSQVYEEHWERIWKYSTNPQNESELKYARELRMVYRMVYSPDI